MKKATCVLTVCVISSMAMCADIDHYNVVWNTPGKDAAGSMPMGNGEVGINLWVEENGDLRFYISRTDSLSEISRLLKVGAVRVSLSPNPFVAGAPFRQELRLRDGICEIRTKGVTLEVFVDSERPVVHVTGQSVEPVKVTATVECWRTERRALAKGDEEQSAWTMKGAPFDLYESADVFPTGHTDAVVWYHRNEESVAFPSTIKLQSLETIADKAKDPLLHRTFGGWLTGKGFAAGAGHAVATPEAVKQFALQVAAPCVQAPTVQAWLDAARKNLADSGNARNRTAKWWQAFWERSWVVTGGGGATEIPGAHHPLRIGVDSNGQNKFPGVIERTQTQLTNGLRLEAWIKLDTLKAGRIFDKVTAGGSDGFLFDTHPGDTLRFIVGNTTLTGPSGVLRTGVWQHVLATDDAASGAMAMYVDDKVLATSGSEAMTVGKAYTLQRYIQGCSTRGTYPPKFNGSIFTVEPKAMGMSFNADWRRWGDSHWHQNIRHIYHPMLAGGDFEMMQPFFSLYETARPLCEARAKLYHGAEGCYFPETMTVWGTYANGDYGWNRGGHPAKDVLCPWWQYAWNQGPELVALMLDYWDYTRDERFLKNQLLPMAASVLKYFDTRFRKLDDGKIVLDPTQAVETLWQGVINDTPTTAGLVDITRRLCALPEKLVPAGQRTFFAKMQAASPAVPVEQGRIAPAEKYNPARSNCENPELYAIWPFRVYGLGRPGIETARAAYAQRVNHLDNGWGYDGNCAALLGLTNEAARILNVKIGNSNRAYRWPATWGPNFDWLPDQDHGGNLLSTTQLMLLQPVGDKLLLLPAWPKEWDVSFKLHAPGNTTVECVYRDGKVEKLVVTPAERSKDIVGREK